MPLAKEPETVPKAPTMAYTPVTPRVGIRPSGEYKNSVVDIRERSITQLLAHAEGSKWVVNYYRQLLTVDMEGASFQYTTDSPTQQYEKINEYPLRVSSPLSVSQNEETLAFEVSGTGLLPYAIVPNTGDLFSGDIGDGRYALFSIEKIVRKTILKNSVYEIDYVLLNYINHEISYILDKCTVRQLYHLDDFIGAQMGPIISSDVLYTYKKISAFIQKASSDYIDRFKDNNTQAILFNDGKTKLYDPYLSVFFDTIMPKESMDYHRIPKLLTTDELTKRTVLDAILYKDKTYCKINPYVETLPVSVYFNLLIYNGVFYTDVHNVINVYNDEDNCGTNDDEYYVFSKAFYTNEVLLGDIESLVRNYLQKKPLNVSLFMSTIESIETQGAKACFYHIPILIALAIDYTRNL